MQVMDKLIDQYIYLVLTHKTMALEDILNRYIYNLSETNAGMISGKTPLFLHVGLSIRDAPEELQEFVWRDLEKKGYKR